MMENKNALIAIALSLLILLGWQYFVANPALEEAAKELDSQNAQNLQTDGSVTPDLNSNTPDLSANSVQNQITILNRDESLQQDQRAGFENDLIKGSIRLKGARLDDLILKNYRETVDKNSSEIKLLSPSQTKNPWFVDFGWTSTNQTLALPNAETLWQLKNGGELSPTSPIELVWNNGEGLIFHRAITIDEAYLFKVFDKVENNTDQDLQLYPYGIIARHGTPQTAGFYLFHEGLIGDLAGELKEIDYKDLQDDVRQEKFENTTGWLGITDKYWAVTLMPEATQTFNGTFRAFNNKGDFNYQSEYLASAMVVRAGQSAEFGSRMFAGAKVSKLIDGYQASENIDHFDLLIDWGWFYFLTKPMFSLLHWLYGLVGNFGIAILCITVIVKLIFFPLANKSYKSMAAMKKLTPEMTAMRERYKDDKMKQQQEMMALYRKHKVNPAAGCWPMLIQIPVFFALYKVIFVTIEMRHAPFFGWIQDLAAPDPTSLFNLFGLIPFDVPQFLMIGVWPLLMGISMFVQMRLNPPPPDKTQAMIFALMPFFFTVLLASFPAGLLIYWTWNNILSILQQAVIMKRQGVKIELMDNLKGMFKPKKSES